MFASYKNPMSKGHKRPGKRFLSVLILSYLCSSASKKSSFLFATAIALATLHTAHAAQCTPGNGGITLPPGFCASVFADNLGHARQLAVAPDGTVYVNTWSGEYYEGIPAPPGGFLIALQDSTGAGHPDRVTRFGPTAAQGNHGGTGIAIYKDGLYAETNDRIVRYQLPKTGGAPVAAAETVVSGLPLGGDHPMHPLMIDAEGHLLVDVGTATNACQPENRVPEVPGADPCRELQTRGGIWRFDANLRNQTFSPASRFATGLRNGEGFATDAEGRIFVTQHGRDQLWDDWPKLYSATQGQELPAEEIVELRPGADYGWPFCYFDNQQQKLVLAPEYGGDGGGKVGVCAAKQAPVAFFPAHWAPDDMKIYDGPMFPAAYQGGILIAFHGSWNRAPGPQGGYNVVFQPMAHGKPSGPFSVFADGFAGGLKQPTDAAFRPAGLAVAPDGALYIADDQKGRVWRVIFRPSAPTKVD